MSAEELEGTPVVSREVALALLGHSRDCPLPAPKLRGSEQLPTPFLSSSCSRFAAIHAEAPEFVEMSVEQEILVTGIKVVDLLAPYAKGGKIGR